MTVGDGATMNFTDLTNGPAGTVSATNPLGIKEDEPLEILIFNGGLGTKYATDVDIPSYNKLFPESKVNFSETTEILESRGALTTLYRLLPKRELKIENQRDCF